LNPKRTADSEPEVARIIPIERPEAITCPVCGSIAVQEKCKLVSRSDIRRGRIVINCSEF
jgi:hypothetical protein